MYDCVVCAPYLLNAHESKVSVELMHVNQNFAVILRNVHTFIKKITYVIS